MKLYKNVPIKDLESILKDGILPASKTGNKRKDINRADNSTDIVYLAKPITKFNSSYHYGDALIEVEVENPTQTEFLENDRNYLYYQEFVTDEVPVNQIKNIYIPKKFSDRVKSFENPSNVNILFVDILSTYANFLAVYSEVETGEDLKNYNTENLERVVSDYGNTVIIDKSTKILLNFSNKDNKLVFEAMLYDEENDLVDYSWTQYTQKGTINDIELKLNVKKSVISNAFNCSVSKLGDDITLETLKNYIRNNQSKFFTKKGDWRQNYRRIIEKLTIEDFKK
ncbi:hypothetical protein VWV84_08055 [Streptococcus agalactiae]|uniref:hypothetical protein n=1 Tax=Streptococcus agalactiae TaxID=1311 RepID=UPI000315A8AB|nr:hypothetical protein [Streptococcus agalactiae]EPW72049.1 hypothetical protein SAG0101_02855 [Streptococcus agalactiae BSU451]QBX23565.1 hypothetical protein Javan14_0063 [Streptococcus phage Javan14]